MKTKDLMDQWERVPYHEGMGATDPTDAIIELIDLRANDALGEDEEEGEDEVPFGDDPFSDDPYDEGPSDDIPDDLAEPTVDALEDGLR